MTSQQLSASRDPLTSCLNDFLPRLPPAATVRQNPPPSIRQVEISLCRRMAIPAQSPRRKNEPRPIVQAHGNNRDGKLLCPGATPRARLVSRSKLCNSPDLRGPVGTEYRSAPAIRLAPAEKQFVGEGHCPLPPLRQRFQIWPESAIHRISAP